MLHVAGDANASNLMTILACRYSFEVPDGWKNEVVGKVP